MKRVLVTAFEPFGGESINPALEIARRLREMPQEDSIEVLTLTVPVTFADSHAVVIDELRRTRFDAVLLIGQAGGRSAVTVERIGINVDDAGIPDNAGVKLTDEPILADGPAAYFATIPVKEVVEAIRAEGIPAAVSNSAGTFVCNHLMYRVLAHLDGSDTIAGFIHVPWLPVQVANRPSQPSMSLDDMTRAIQAAIRALF